MSVRYAAADDFDDLAQLDSHGNLDQASVRDLAGKREDLGPFAPFRTHARKPAAAFADDRRNVGVGFDVVDERGLSPEAADCRIRRPRLRCSAPAFDRCNQRSLFAAYKGTGAKANFHVEVEGCVANVVAEQSASPRFAQAGRQTAHGQRILSAYVDETFAGADCVSRDGHAFNHALRIALKNTAIHKRARIAFIAIADYILYVSRCLGNCAPLQAGGISAAAASAQTAGGDLMDDAVRCHVGKGSQQGPVAVAGDVVVDLFRIDVSGVLENHVNLLVKVIAQIALQLGDRLVAQAGDDGFCGCRR